MPIDTADLQAIALTLELASLATVLLLIIGTPIAWWLARTASRMKGPVGAVVALPLVLPPTVIGFYLLVLMGPNGMVGKLTQAAGIGLLPFTFAGLVVGSVIYSLPFVVQPLQNAFEAIGRRPLEAAATLRAGPWDTFFWWRCRSRGGHRHGDDSRLRAHRRRIRRRADDRRQHSGAHARGLRADFRSRRSPGIRAGALAGGRHGAVFVRRASSALFDSTDGGGACLN